MLGWAWDAIKRILAIFGYHDARAEAQTLASEKWADDEDYKTWLQSVINALEADELRTSARAIHALRSGELQKAWRACDEGRLVWAVGGTGQLLTLTRSPLFPDGPTPPVNAPGLTVEVKRAHPRAREVADETYKRVVRMAGAYAAYTSILTMSDWPSEADRQHAFVDASNDLSSYYRENRIALSAEVGNLLDDLMSAVRKHHMAFAMRKDGDDRNAWPAAYQAGVKDGEIDQLRVLIEKLLREAA